jgi:hypothetical protein
VLELHPTPFDHPDSLRLIAEIQQVYRERYGGEDATEVDPREFDAPGGFFVVGYAEGEPVACGGWRARHASEGDPLRDGDAEVKRMYVAAAAQRSMRGLHRPSPDFTEGGRSVKSVLGL